MRSQYNYRLVWTTNIVNDAYGLTKLLVDTTLSSECLWPIGRRTLSFWRGLTIQASYHHIRSRANRAMNIVGERKKLVLTKVDTKH
jgi:hypothetical protein